MAEDVSEILSELKELGPPGFSPEPWYNAPGDCLIWHSAPDEYYGERIDDKLTVFRSLKTDAIVGCQIKGVIALAKKFGSYECEFESKGLSLRLLVIAAHFDATPVGFDPLERKRAYDVLLEDAGDRNLSLNLANA